MNDAPDRGADPLLAALSATAEPRCRGCPRPWWFGDRVAWCGAAGLSDLATATPARASTVYLWFSMTKMVTATAVVSHSPSGAPISTSPSRTSCPSSPGATGR